VLWIPPTKNNYLASLKIAYTVNKVGNIKSLKKFVISSFPAPWVAVMLSALRWETLRIQSVFKILR